MARVILPTPFGLVRGKLNKTSDVVFYVHNGQQHCRRAPQKRDLSLSPYTEKELAIQNNFKAAHQYVAETLADPARKKHYEKLWKEQRGKFSTLRGYIVHCYYAEYLHE